MGGEQVRARSRLSGVRIWRVAYAPVRVLSDTGTNKSLNAEYVQIKNTGTTSRSLKGWTLRDESRHVYTFGSFTLGAGKTVTVRTGTGTNTSATRYWNKAWYVWNNSGGDSATLRNAGGAGVDTCSWKTVASYVNC